MTDKQDPFVRQWKLEAEAARLGAERLRRATEKMESREYASGTIWGKKLTEVQLVSITKAITAKRSAITQGKAQKGAIKLQDVLDLIEPEVLAVIAVKRALDLIAIGKTSSGKRSNTYANVCNAIGRAVESEGRFRWYEHVGGKEWKACKALYFKPTTGTRQKEVVSRTIMKRRGYEWKRWPNAKAHHVGAFLLDRIAESTPWLMFDKKEKAGRQSHHLVELNPLAKNWKENVQSLAESGSPLTWPMVCPPADWGNKVTGGYLTSQLRQSFSLIRGQRAALMMGDLPLNMLNTLQRVGYRINPATYNLMVELNERSWDLDSFVVRQPEEPIPYPGEDKSREELHEWRRLRTEQENRNAALTGKRYRTLETLEIASRFHKEEELYIPWSFDYRGRVYPLVSFMSPQGTGMEKSLFLFKDGQPITLGAVKWLSIHLANTAGHDKLPMRERVSWVHQNLGLITRIATDPIGNFSELEGMDDPWCFYAAAEEFYHCVILKDRKTTSIPVATDATCSGLQHLSAMTLDGATGALVNVSPGAQPQDAYKAVLKRTLELLRSPSRELIRWASERNAKAYSEYEKAVAKAQDKGEEPPKPPQPIVLPNEDLADWGERVGRKLTKRVVMTVPYAATPHSNRGYIKEAIDDYEEAMAKAIEDVTARKSTGAELSTLTHVMLTAMAEVVPGPIAVMEWIKSNVGEFFSDGHDGTVSWITPSGFPVRQDKRDHETIRVKTHLLGEVVMTRVKGPDTTVNVNKHKSSSAPNFIHSMDASLLHMSFAGYDKPFTLIHDSILTTATDMGYMSKVIREQFYELYKDAPLLKYADTINAPRPDHLIKGDLKIEDVARSQYFFC